MLTMKFGLAGLGALVLLAAPASACTVPTESPYDPTQYPSQLVIEGVATSNGQSDGEPYADVKVSDVFIGKYAASSIRLKWWIYDGAMCEPPGPAVEAGQRVRIYLRQSKGNLEPQGWVLTEESPKSKDQIQKDQAVAQERLARQDQYFAAGGALSYNDPKVWLKIEDIPELRRSKFPIIVSFSVGPNGTMENCDSGHVKPYQKLDLKACKIIRQRARLVPPKFPEETYGSFDSDAAEAD